MLNIKCIVILYYIIFYVHKFIFVCLAIWFVELYFMDVVTLVIFSFKDSLYKLPLKNTEVYVWLFVVLSADMFVCLSLIFVEKIRKSSSWKVNKICFYRVLKSHMLCVKTKVDIWLAISIKQ